MCLCVCKSEKERDGERERERDWGVGVVKLDDPRERKQNRDSTMVTESVR